MLPLSFKTAVSMRVLSPGYRVFFFAASIIMSICFAVSSLIRSGSGVAACSATDAFRCLGATGLSLVVFSAVFLVLRRLVLVAVPVSSLGGLAGFDGLGALMLTPNNSSRVICPSNCLVMVCTFFLRAACALSIQGRTAAALPSSVPAVSHPSSYDSIVFMYFAQETAL